MQPQPVGNAVPPDCVQPGVGQQYFQPGAGGRIAVEGGLNIRFGFLKEAYHGKPAFLSLPERGVHHSTRSAYRAVLKYRSPNDGMITTIILPVFSGRLATCMAAQMAAPEEIPTSSPSRAAASRAVRKASSFFTRIISS